MRYGLLVKSKGPDVGTFFPRGHHAEVAALEPKAQNRYAAIKLWAERRAGQLLKEGKKEGQIRKQGRHSNVRDNTKISKPKITKDQSARWQQLAADKSTVSSWRRAIEVMEVVPISEPKHIQPSHACEISRHAPDVPEEKFDEALNTCHMPSGTNILACAAARCRSHRRKPCVPPAWNLNSQG